jgi:hypothetical protein
MPRRVFEAQNLPGPTTESSPECVEGEQGQEQRSSLPRLRNVWANAWRPAEEVGYTGIDRDASFRLPDGTEVPFRNTCVFVREDGEWKLIHGHTSIGVRNEEIFGEDITAPSLGYPRPS